MLYLVRHAMPDVDPACDPATWPLGSQGRAAARQLADVLPSRALLIASDEPKAWQTLDPSGEREVHRDRRLAEVRRSEEFRDDFRRLRRSYVCGAVIDGWEPQEDVTRRFTAAVGEAGQQAGGRDLVIASHGMAITVWLTQAVALADPGSFWADLRFPDLFAVDLWTGTVVRHPSDQPDGRD